MPNWKLVITSGSDAVLNSLNVKTYVSASSFNGSFTGSLNGTASQAVSSSYALTASYALNGGGGGGISAIYILDEGVVQGTASYFDFTGAGVTATVNNNTASIYIPGGGGGSNTNSQNAILSQTSPALTWSFTHNLSTLYPVFTIYDNEDNVIIPQKIHAETTSSAFIYFSSARTGTAVASKGGDVVSASFAATASLAYNAVSSSYAYTASSAISASFASTASKAQDAEDILVYVKNSTGAQINKGSVVRISGSVGDNPLISLADWTNDANSANTLGFTYQNIPNDGFGYVITEGRLIGVDTTSYTAGQLIYLGANGAITGSAPRAPLHAVRLGQVLRVQLNNGSIYVRIDNGYELGELHDVVDNTTSTSFGDILVKSGSVWINSKQLTGSYAITGSLTITDTLTAQTLVVQTITSSVLYSSGSNTFGNDLSNRQTFTGSVLITGSLNVNGSNAILTNQTASMSVASAISSSYAYTASSAISSSLAQTASYVVTAQTASYVENAVSSSYAFTASSAISSSYAYTASSAINASASLISVSSSYALTASYALNGGGGGVSAIYIQDEGITQGTASYFNFTGAGVTATVTDSTASINITGGGSSGTSGLSTTFTQSVAANTWTFVHNLNTRYPLIQVYDTTYNQITPQYVSSSTADTVIIGFGIATAGYAVASNGGTLYVTGSNVILDQAVAAATWSFTHNLNTQYPIFQVFDSNNEVMIPERIVATDATSSLFYFPSAVAGKAVASVGGISGSMGSGVGFPFSGSAVITGSFLVSQSFVDFSNTTGVSGSFTGSLYGTSSYATFALSASFAPGFTTNMSQSVAATTWSFTHNLNTINPIVQVYDLTNAQIIPNQIVGMNNSTAEIRFDYAQAGYAVASNGGGLYVTGSTSTLVQTVGAVTWSFTHNLNNKYNTYEVYDSNDTVIIPSGIKALTNNTAELYFATSQTGRAVAQFSGINGSPNAATASYANTASFVSNLTQNVFITGSLTVTGSAAFTGSLSQNNGFVVLTQVSQSLNYADDNAAAAGGVPLGGLYRNGNFILIRLS